MWIMLALKIALTGATFQSSSHTSSCSGNRRLGNFASRARAWILTRFSASTSLG
jgi:hypothetical protein